MIIRVQPQHFLRHQFQREQQFRPVGKQPIHVRAAELNNYVRTFIRIAVVAGLNCEIEFEASVGNRLPQELLNYRSGFVDGKLWIQTRFAFACLSLLQFLRRLRGNYTHRQSSLIKEPLLGNTHDVASEPV